MSQGFVVRPAEPGDAEELTRLAEAVSGEPEAWLISADGEWRSVGDERRYLKALRRYPHAAVFVAEGSDGVLLGRLSVARDSHPASAHVADLGLMVAKDARRQGVGRALLEAAVDWAHTAASASWSCTSSRGTSPPSACTNASASNAKASARPTTTEPARTWTRS